MGGKYFTATVRPNMDNDPGTVFDDGDLIFDWTPFEVPKGAVVLASMVITQFGRDGVASALDEDMQLYFAKSINGVAPANLGTQHSMALAATTTKSRRNIIGMTFLDRSAMVDTVNVLHGFSTWSNTGTGTNMHESGNWMVLEGDPSYASTEGYQTIWVAGLGNAGANGGEYLFDTSIASAEDGSANVAADMTGANVVLKTSGTDPRNVFAPGDIAIGSTGGPTMEVVSVDTATQMTVKNLSEQLDNAEIINPRNPFTFVFGFHL